MIILSTILSGLSLLMSVLFLFHLRSPLGWIVTFAKLAAGALSPIWAIMGAVGALIGWVYGAFWAIPLGILGAGMMIWYGWRCTRDHKGFEQAFGADWSDQLPTEGARHMIKKRWRWFLKMKTSPELAWERDIAFWTIPSTDRQLLCDVWCPANGDVSGLAFVYFHGGAWSIGDKDTFTRPFFRHLVAQGHTVMDVSYRLCPEVDIYGMIGDVKRAIAWMKANASRYGVNPAKIVLGGGSAGGHLSLLAGYTPQHPELTPDDLKSADLSVCGVISHYGPTDLLAVYQHTNQHRLVNLPPVPIGTQLDSKMRTRDAGRLDILLGGHPQDAPEMYQLASPITHVHPGCPPTLLIQGNHDVVCPVDATYALHTKLAEAGVPAINVIFPSTAHGFDLLFPQISPPAQSALYDVDRFLALLLNKG
jgi:acetyl esterase/lipase